jgi:hypothetical protein
MAAVRIPVNWQRRDYFGFSCENSSSNAFSFLSRDLRIHAGRQVITIIVADCDQIHDESRRYAVTSSLTKSAQPSLSKNLMELLLLLLLLLLLFKSYSEYK